MSTSPIHAVEPLSRPQGLDAVQQPQQQQQPSAAQLQLQQSMFEQLMMQTGFTLLNSTKADDASNEDDEG